MERAISPLLGSMILVRFPLVFHVYMYFKRPVLTSQTDKTDFPPAFLRDQQQRNGSLSSFKHTIVFILCSVL